MAEVIINIANQTGARRELATRAACEISQIVDCLNQQQKTDGAIHPDLWRGMYLRLDTLVSVAIGALDDDVDSIERLADEVYGPSGWKPLHCSA